MVKNLMKSLSVLLMCLSLILQAPTPANATDDKPETEDAPTEYRGFQLLDIKWYFPSHWIDYMKEGGRYLFFDLSPEFPDQDKVNILIGNFVTHELGVYSEDTVMNYFKDLNPNADYQRPEFITDKSLMMHQAQGELEIDSRPHQLVTTMVLAHPNAYYIHVVVEGELTDSILDTYDQLLNHIGYEPEGYEEGYWRHDQSPVRVSHEWAGISYLPSTCWYIKEEENESHITFHNNHIIMTIHDPQGQTLEEFSNHYLSQLDSVYEVKGQLEAMTADSLNYYGVNVMTSAEQFSYQGQMLFFDHEDKILQVTLLEYVNTQVDYQAVRDSFLADILANFVDQPEADRQDSSISPDSNKLLYQLYDLEFELPEGLSLEDELTDSYLTFMYTDPET